MKNHVRLATAFQQIELYSSVIPLFGVMFPDESISGNIMMVIPRSHGQFQGQKCILTNQIRKKV